MSLWDIVRQRANQTVRQTVRRVIKPVEEYVAPVNVTKRIVQVSVCEKKYCGCAVFKSVQTKNMRIMCEKQKCHDMFNMSVCK